MSRIDPDMHWLSDVIGGFTLGSAYLLIALWASQLIFTARPAAAVAKPAKAIDPPDNAGVGSGVVDRGIMIRKLAAGGYRLYSRKKDPKTGKRRNLGTFATRAAAEKHERAVQYFKRH